MKRKLLCLAMSWMLTASALADERASLEALRQTTVNLIDALVEQGVFTREKADAMIKAAETRAAATAQKTAKAEAGRVRVQYVPEIVKTEIREQLRQEVLAQARTERWAEPNAIPQWLDTIKIEGDLRLSYRLDKFAKDNATPANFAFEAFNDLVQTNAAPGALGGVGGISGAGAEAGQTRAADLASVNSLGVANANSKEHRERLRLRARLGILAVGLSHELLTPRPEGPQKSAILYGKTRAQIRKRCGVGPAAPCRSLPAGFCPAPPAPLATRVTSPGGLTSTVTATSTTPTRTCSRALRR